MCACVFATGITAVAFAIAAATAAALVLRKCATEVWDQLHETENTVAYAQWTAYSDSSRQAALLCPASLQLTCLAYVHVSGRRKELE